MTLETILKNQENVKVIDLKFDYNSYYPLDLSVTNANLDTVSLTNADEFESYINSYLAANKGSVAYGGYNEKRNLYKRSTDFKDDQTEERNIHIGLDLWVEKGTTVLAALDGKVHSFENNDSLGNYGPTIILKHRIDNCTFYTLYGHLSLDSIEDIKVGQEFKKGDKIARLGGASVNGDYAPHLHFQIIADIGDYSGDYPGVCSATNQQFYLKNCPDPNLLLKIKL
ncbi:peptidase M23 [Flavobacterium faecale]|uniref:Peptidase M23 n=1 Tax=Flavobacterium faecale TaxID=1355330 RepID=A0A2S1L9H5_9FLAO|nr:peptidoglycan DD-metalloendopeptidase family protein [Flavobacterium faecale]AWG20226.1 peptidase M23 [Flavobacterium faecale]